MEDEDFLCMEYKSTPKWVWPGSRDLISKFWDTERKELPARNLVQT